MSKKTRTRTRTNRYRIDEENGVAIFETQNSGGNKNGEFVVDIEDMDVALNHKWSKQFSSAMGGYKIESTICGKKVNLTSAIARKYVCDNILKSKKILRLDTGSASYCKTNIILADNNLQSLYGNVKNRYIYHSNSKLNTSGDRYIHVARDARLYNGNESVSYFAAIHVNGKFAQPRTISKTFSENKTLKAKERAIYAAYLFEKEYCGDDFFAEEYRRKERAFELLNEVERAEVEDLIIDQLGELKVARKKINKYLESQTLEAKLSSGEIKRPLKDSQHEKVLVESTKHIQCSGVLLNSIRKNCDKGTYTFVHSVIKHEGLTWRVLGGLPTRGKCFNIEFSSNNHRHAKEMAVYAAHLFAKLVYGENFPQSEYERNLETIKVLSADEIDLVNESVVPKLENVYTILKEILPGEPVDMTNVY